MRTFTNKLGVTFDPLKTSVVFAEDMNAIVNAIESLVIHEHTFDFIESVAATPTTPFFVRTLAANSFDVDGVNYVMDVDLGFITFDASTSLSLKLDSDTIFNLGGNVLWSSGGPANLQLRFVRKSSSVIQCFAKLTFNNQYFQCFWVLIPSFDFTIDHDINFFAAAATDGDVKILQSSAVYESN